MELCLVLQICSFDITEHPPCAQHCANTLTVEYECLYQALPQCEVKINQRHLISFLMELRVILCPLASLCHVTSFRIPFIHSHQHLTLAVLQTMCWPLGHHHFVFVQKMQIHHTNLPRTIRKVHDFSKMRSKAKYKVFLLVTPHHGPGSAFIDWELT